MLRRLAGIVLRWGVMRVVDSVRKVCGKCGIVREYEGQKLVFCFRCGDMYGSSLSSA